MSSSPREPWVAVRRPLSAGRQALLVLFSFLTPIIIWSIISYVPFIWHPDVKLEIGGVFDSTVYTSGDHVGKEYYPVLKEKIQVLNDQVLQDRKGAEAPSGSKRSNLKVLRRLVPYLVKYGYLSEIDEADDGKIYQAWGELAAQPHKSLDEDNTFVIQDNWRILSGHSSTYSKSNFPSAPLLQLYPYGKPANPDYLPAPHTVLKTGIQDWKKKGGEGQPSMAERYGQSLRTILLGFLIAAVIAIPLGVLSGTYDLFSKLVEPFWDFFRYMPAPAFGTLLVAIFGAHSMPKVALVFLGTFPHLLLMLTKTIRLVEKPLLEAAQTLGANRNTLLTKVVVPSALPSIYNDLRIALGWAWTWLVIAELIGVKEGLTEVIDTQGVRRNFDRVYPVIILIRLSSFHGSLRSKKAVSISS